MLRFARRVINGVRWRIKYRYRASTRNLFLDLCYRRRISKSSVHRLNDNQKSIYTFISSHPAYRRQISRPKQLSSVSVVIAHYNQQEVLGQSIESVLGQSLEPKEIIIVDDLSEDRAYTKSVVDGFSRHGNVKALFPEAKLYLGGARNLGASVAEGDIIQFFDADDIMHPQRLQIVHDVMNRYPDCFFVVTGYLAFRGDVPGIDYFSKEQVRDALIEPSTMIADCAVKYSKSKLSYIDQKTKEVPWYAWGGFGASGARSGCCSGNPAIVRECVDILKWNTPKDYLFSPYEDLEYCLLLLALVRGIYHIDLPLTYYRRGYTKSMPMNEI